MHQPAPNTPALEVHPPGTLTPLSELAPALANAIADPNQVITHPFLPTHDHPLTNELIQAIRTTPLRHQPLTELLPNLKHLDISLEQNFHPNVTPAAPAVPTRVLHNLLWHLGRQKGSNATRNWADVVAFSPEELQRIPGLGNRSLDALLRTLITLGFELKATQPPKAIPASAEDLRLTGLLPHLEGILIWANTQHRTTNLLTALQQVTRRKNLPADVQAHLTALQQHQANFPTPLPEATQPAAEPPQPKAKAHPLAAACDALLDAFAAGREQQIFVQRIINPEPATLEALGQQFNVTRERIRQLENGIRKNLNTILSNPVYDPLLEGAAALEGLLGPLAPNEHRITRQVLTDLFTGNPSVEHRNLIFWVAGPYQLIKHRNQRSNIWVSSQQAYTDFIETMRREIPQDGLSRSDTQKLVENYGINPEFTDALLNHAPNFMLWRDHWFPHRLTMPERGVLALAELGRPATIEEIHAAAGLLDHGILGLGDRLRQDPRVIRSNKDHLALREWGLPEYSSIFDAMLQELKAARGPVKLAELVKKLAEDYGASAGSVRAYADAPAFIHGQGVIRLRKNTEPYPIPDDLHAKAGVYNHDSRITVSLEVSSELLRGSGISIPPSLTNALGVTPGETTTYAEANHEVRINWLPSGWNGGALSSVRPFLLSANPPGEAGHQITLTFHPATRTVTASVFNPDLLEPFEALRLLTGITATTFANAATQLGKALNHPESILKALEARGDHAAAQTLLKLKSAGEPGRMPVRSRFYHPQNRTN